MTDTSGHTTRLDLPLLLPEVQDLRDACVERIVQTLQQRAGAGPRPFVHPSACWTNRFEGRSTVVPGGTAP